MHRRNTVKYILQSEHLQIQISHIRKLEMNYLNKDTSIVTFVMEISATTVY